MPRIFVSYTSRDRPLARAVVRLLRSSGFVVWIDEERVPAGQTASRAVLGGLEFCEAVVVVWTTQTGGSRWVPSEVGFARSRGVDLVVVRKGHALLPHHLHSLHRIDCERVDFAARLRRWSVRATGRHAARRAFR